MTIKRTNDNPLDVFAKEEISRIRGIAKSFLNAVEAMKEAYSYNYRSGSAECAEVGGRYSERARVLNFLADHFEKNGLPQGYNAIVNGVNYL